MLKNKKYILDSVSFGFLDRKLTIPQIGQNMYALKHFNIFLTLKQFI